MSLYPLKELVRLARERSEFYRVLYARLPQNVLLEDLPIVDQAKLWSLNGFDRNRVLTASPSDGIVFKSGGTTGNPKFSFYTREEWKVFTTTFGRALSSHNMAGAKRVANLFYAGELYASFLFIHESLENSATPTLNFPISGGATPEGIVHMVNDLYIDTLAGLPTTMLAIADHLVRTGETLPSVQRLLCGGESVYPDQRALLEEAMPGVKVMSVGYASVDAGLLGYADDTCGPNEHRCFDETILEIIDEETGKPIHEEGKPGKIVITSLTRLLMPIIRYPAGDRAEWVEGFSPTHRNRKFRLLGRSEEAARIGPVSVYFEDVQGILAPFVRELALSAYQLHVTHQEGRDCLTLRLAVSNPKTISDELLTRVQAAFLESRPMFAELAEEKKIHPVRWELVEPSSLRTNPRTGKMRRIIDERIKS